MVEMSLDGQHFTAILEQNRTWLLRWFTSRCGSPDIAEDLVQETSLEAWRNRHKFTVPGGERGWLATIGNHVFRRWQRTMGRSRVTTMPADCANAGIERPRGAASTDNDAMDDVVERQELASFIELASYELAASARDLLRDRYYRELTIAEMAERAGLSAPHMAVRIQRARNQLRAVVLSSYAPDAESFGYGASYGNPQRTTRLWCPRCGHHRLLTLLDAHTGRFTLFCPACNRGEGDLLYNWQVEAMHDHHPLTGVRSAPQALARTLASAMWKIPASHEQRACPDCAEPVQCRFRTPAFGDDAIANTQIELWCSTCGFLGQSATFAGMAIFHPAGMQLWREHGRIRTTQILETTVGNTPAVAVTLASISSPATRTFAFTADGSRLLLID